MNILHASVETHIWVFAVSVIDVLDNVVHPLPISGRQTNHALDVGIAELDCSSLNLIWT